MCHAEFVRVRAAPNAIGPLQTLGVVAIIANAHCEQLNVPTSRAGRTRIRTRTFNHTSVVCHYTPIGVHATRGRVGVERLADNRAEVDADARYIGRVRLCEVSVLVPELIN